MLFLRFGVSEFNGVESIAFFGELKRIYNAFAFKVFKESDNDFTDSEFYKSWCVVEIAFIENVVEGEDRNHLFVKSNFDNTVKDVKFNFDDSSSVLHVRNVVECVVIGQQLIIFDFSRKIKRGLVVKVDYG